MKWISLLWQLLIPLGITLYTINFGKWMAARDHKSGAIGAYLVAALSIGVTVVALLRNSL